MLGTHFSVFPEFLFLGSAYQQTTCDTVSQTPFSSLSFSLSSLSFCLYIFAFCIYSVFVQ